MDTEGIKEVAEGIKVPQPFKLSLGGFCYDTKVEVNGKDISNNVKSAKAYVDVETFQTRVTLELVSREDSEIVEVKGYVLSEEQYEDYKRYKMEQSR